MSYGIPVNLCVTDGNGYRLLWEYDGTDFTNGAEIKLNLMQYSLVIVQVTNLKNDRYNKAYILVNDSTSSYEYVLGSNSQNITEYYRTVKVNEDGLTFSKLSWTHGLTVNNTTSVIPYRIYGVG